MPRRRKRKTDRPPPPSPRQPELFNPVLTSVPRLSQAESPPAPEETTEPTAQPPAPPEDQNGFRQAMADVRPLATGKRLVLQPNPALRPARPARDEDLEALTQLSDLVSGVAEMDISFSDEYIEGSLPGLHPKIMRRLRKGHFPVQDHVDLHGLTQQAAEDRLREFLQRSHRVGLRCVLVIHGRGLNSANHIPVLKERLPGWLSRGPARRIVLAFSTARPFDGGTGAIYVLLRRNA